MRERQEDYGGARQFVLLGDVSKAHRRVVVRRADWGLQACRLSPGSVWVNCVGTYGIGSAGYWWSRLASGLLVRLFYYFMSVEGNADSLLFADDLKLIAGRAKEIQDLGLMVLIWVALGAPWKWKKFRGGDNLSWIGYQMCWASFKLGVSEGRSRWLTDWIFKTVEAGIVDVADFRAVLGRLTFALGALEYLRPFSSPLHAWLASIDHLGKVKVPSCSS